MISADYVACNRKFVAKTTEMCHLGRKTESTVLIVSGEECVPCAGVCIIRRCVKESLFLLRKVDGCKYIYKEAVYAKHESAEVFPYAEKP